MNLILSLVALALGPVLYGAAQKHASLRSALDGLLFVTIAGIVVVHIVPDVFAVAEYWALAFIVAGALFAFFVERAPSVGGGDRYMWIILLGAIGLAIHAAVDGIALIPDDHLGGLDSHGGGHDHHDHAGHAHVELGHKAESSLLENHLALGVILHRIPVGMAIWWVVRPRLGKATAISALAIIAGATSIGYFFGEPVIELMQATGVACFQAFVAGTLLHVIVFTSANGHSSAQIDDRSRSVVGERLGIIIGLFIIFLLPHAH
ncbi:MAG: hypothetical protein AAF351_03960 [Pseudomonadota bacterium]